MRSEQHPVQQDELHHPQRAIGGDVGRLHRQRLPAATEFDGASGDETHRQRRQHQTGKGQCAERRDLPEDRALRLIEPDPAPVELEGRHCPHRGGEHVGQHGVHAEQADEYAENCQAGHSGDT